MKIVLKILLVSKLITAIFQLYGQLQIFLVCVFVLFFFFIKKIIIIFILGFVNRECENLRDVLQKASNLDNCLVLNTPSNLINASSVASNRVSPSVTATESLASDSGIDGISSAASHQSESSLSSIGSSIWPSPSNLISQYSMIGANNILNLSRVFEVFLSFIFV